MTDALNEVNSFHVNCRGSFSTARLNGLALAYIHKPTKIDSTSVLKIWDVSGHRRIALAFTKK